MTATLPLSLRLAGRGVLAGFVGLLGLAAFPQAADAVSTRDQLPPGRRIVEYTVKPGDTATELAVRFHAWTAELISYNDLGSGATMYVGQELRIPVVIAAARKDKDNREAKRATHQRQERQHPRQRARRDHTERRHVDSSKARIRQLIVRTAHRQGVDPHLALAVSWQEAGWEMHHTSSAGAIGAMQVLPTTGLWMSMYADRFLHLRDARDNVLAGVLLLRVLDDMTKTRRGKIGAYYQGIGAVREHWLYPDTKQYVANVLALKHRLENGWNPAR